MSSLFSALDIHNMRDLTAAATALVTWRNFALLLALINLKALPLGWHFRVLYHFIANVRLKPTARFFPKGRAIVDAHGNPTHPVFVPCSVYSRTPLLETDYNLHKSNSTYFSDLDISRAALVTRLFSPGIGLISKELDQEFLEASVKEGKKAPRRLPVMVVLGSVYCTFKREIKPYEKYEMQSRIISWDKKWTYILTAFLRPAKKAGGEKTLLATALSKYVVKKGRLTVSPERILRTGGFLPERPEESQLESSVETSAIGTPASGEGITATGVDGSLVREVLKISEDQIPDRETLEEKKKVNSDSWNPEEWPWERIEQERLRGIDVVLPFINMDGRLEHEVTGK
ncbi:hypothetical protein N7456_008040 [Penicillium angulare]|uniref:Thioesterase atnL n=1 Tax=Penicillium angulare TaxID=116970 RepID=A0A9W9K8Q7_9EURO|nr:hypothetical protein N7456_008040 [Penicillium angulare]